MIALLRVRPGAIMSAAALARLFHPRETGGILLGYRIGASIVVEDMVWVPSEPEASQYRRSEESASRVLREYLGAKQAGLVGYVGEWHSHPTIHSASVQDVTELAALAALSPGPTLAMIVLGMSPDEREPFGYVCARHGFPVRVPIARARVIRARRADRCAVQPQ